MKLKPTWRNVLMALNGAPGWVGGHMLPDGNGRNGCARGDVLSAMRKAGVIEYGKEPAHSHYGWRITGEGHRVLSQGVQPEPA